MDSLPKTHSDAGRCPLCDNPNYCALCTTPACKDPCWCAKVKIPDELLARVPVELRDKACICENCIKEAQRPKNSETAPLKILPGDFYLENNLMVFTAAYLLRRGYCCGSGCRHCPY